MVQCKPTYLLMAPKPRREQQVWALELRFQAAPERNRRTTQQGSKPAWIFSTKKYGNEDISHLDQ